MQTCQTMASLAAEIEAIVHMFYIWSKKKIKNTILEVSEPLDGSQPKGEID